MPPQDYNQRWYGVFGTDGFDELGLFLSGWGADFNDPSDFANPLFSNTSTYSNVCQTNDSYLQNLMELGLSELNPTLRKGIYDEIQRYMVEDLMPAAFIYSPKAIDVFLAPYEGFQQNTLGFKQFNTIYISQDLEVSSPTDLYFEYGESGKNITWIVTDSAYKDRTYTVYRGSTLISSGSWTTDNPVFISVSGLDLGEYSYIINVSDGLGEIKTDQVQVFVYNLEPSIIDSPRDLNYEFGSTNNYISWTFRDSSVSNPSYTFYIDGISKASGSWISEDQIVFNVDGLSIGVHQCIVEVSDGLGDTIQDIVSISVSTPIIIYIVIIGSVIGIVSAISIILILLRRRRRLSAPKKFSIDSGRSI